MSKTVATSFSSFPNLGETFFDISHDLMCVTTIDGSIQLVNPRFIESTGQGLSELKLEKYLSFVHPDDLPQTIRSLKNIHKEKTGVVYSNRFRAKNNEYRNLEWTIISDKKNNLIYFSGKDITEEKIIERKTIQSSRIYSVGELTVGISSLMSNLISIIGGNISLIYMQIEKEQFDKEDLKKNMLSIDNANQKLGRIIKGLRSFIRTPENDPVTNVQLSHVITNVLGLCQEKFRIYAVKLKIVMNEDLVFRCRATQLAQMFVNLLNSSFEAVHSDRDGWVELEIVPMEDIIKISISDSRNRDTTNTKDLTNQIPKELINENSAKIYLDTTSKNWKANVELSKQEKVSMEIL